MKKERERNITRLKERRTDRESGANYEARDCCNSFIENEDFRFRHKSNLRRTCAKKPVMVVKVLCYER